MPNLAVEIGEGVICHAEVPSEHRSGAIGEALGLLGAIATVVEVEESQLDAATAVMGCAPAYIALAVEALIEAGAEAGLDDDLGSMLVSEAAAGVGRHLLTREPGEMQRASPPRAAAPKPAWRLWRSARFTTRSRPPSKHRSSGCEAREP